MQRQALIVACVLSLVGSIWGQTTDNLSSVTAFRIFAQFPANQDTGVITAYNNPNGNIQQSIILFDLSSIPSHGTVQSATLTLTMDGTYYGNSGGVPSNIFRVAESWDASANWNTRDGSTAWTNLGGTFLGTDTSYLASPYASNATPYANGSFPTATMTFDVSSLVQQWVNGTYANNGFGLAGEQNDFLEFYASGGSGPMLSVTYAIPEPGAAAALAGLAGLGMVLWRRRRSA